MERRERIGELLERRTMHVERTKIYLVFTVERAFFASLVHKSIIKSNGMIYT
jgi:hypothetical protein